jgi:hypothetical protein
VLGAKGDPTDYLPQVPGWTRSTIERAGGAVQASTTYRRAGAPTDVSAIDVIVNVYPTEVRARSAFNELVRKYRTVIGSCVNLPGVGCITEDVESYWLGFGTTKATAVIDVRVTSSTLIAVNVREGFSQRFRDVHDYLQAFANAYVPRLP